jgi:hypothetical protein
MLHKYVIVKMHHIGLNQHVYWTGSSWTPKLENAILYPSDVDAESVLDTFMNRALHTVVRVEIQFLGRP